MAVPFAGAQDVPEQLPREETLYIAGLQWGPFNTFNPLSANPTWPSNGEDEYLYETLFAFNLLTGELDPLLAKELVFVDDTTANVTMQEDTHWQDGEPLTVNDVVFTYGLAKEHDDLDYSVFWDYVTEVNATGDLTIEFKLNPDRLNAGLFKRYLSNVHILPEHIWAERAAGDTPLSQIVDEEPVGSGPYKVLDYSIERVALIRDDNYWGIPIFGTPAPTYIVHPIFDSNDAGNLAFQNGEVDLSQQFAPQVWKMWEDNGLPVGTWYDTDPYHVPGNIPMMILNTSRPGLDNPLVRRAMAYSINYAQIAATAMSRYAVLPQVTGLALSIGSMVSGALITEVVFGYPGIGSLLFTSIRQSDYPVIQGVTLLIMVAVLLANFLVDIAYGFIDPRIRARMAGER
jgi:peptide/nickel transport system substrate-binding protein